MCKAGFVPAADFMSCVPKPPEPEPEKPENSSSAAPAFVAALILFLVAAFISSAALIIKVRNTAKRREEIKVIY